MKKVSPFVVCLVLSFQTSPLVFADSNQEQDPFISLTRRPTPHRNLPTNVSVISSEEIEALRPLSLPDLLEKLTAIDVSRSGSLGSLTTIRIRGVSTADQVQVVIDDQPIGGVSVQNTNIDLIPTEDIERIEVVRGGSSVLYGANTIGGVVHIFTKRYTGDSPHVSIGYEGGSFQTKKGRASAAAKGERVSASLFGGAYNTDGFQDNADVKNRDGSGTIGLFFPNGSSINTDISVTNRDLGSPNGTPVPFDEWDGEKERRPNSATQRIENNMGRARLKGETPIANRGSVQTSIYHSRETYKLRLTPTSDPLATYDNRILGQDTRLLLDKGITLGFAYERDERTSQGQLPHHIVNWGAYGQKELKFHKLLLTPAIRFDQHGTFGNNWNPRMTVVYKALANLNFSANAARSFRSPTLVDLYIAATDPFYPAFDFFGNPNLQPERAVTYDAGVWTAWGESFESKITGFFTRIRDRIDTVDTDGNGNVDTLMNLSKAEIYGAELEMQAKTGILSHKTNLTLQHAKGTTTQSTQFVSLRLTPRYLFNYQLNIYLPMAIQMVNTIQASGYQYEQDNNLGVRLPSYALWHARFNKQMRILKLFLSVQNILDKRYGESVTFGNAVPQPGRTYWAGGGIAFGGEY